MKSQTEDMQCKKKLEDIINAEYNGHGSRCQMVLSALLPLMHETAYRLMLDDSSKNDQTAKR